MTDARAAVNNLLLIVLPPPKMPAAIGAGVAASFSRCPPGGTGRRRLQIASTVLLPSAAHSLACAEKALQQHGHDDNRADRGALPVRIDIEQVEAVADQHHDQDANESAYDGAASAEKAGPADHHGGDRIELEASRGDRIDR